MQTLPNDMEKTYPTSTTGFKWPVWVILLKAVFSQIGHWYLVINRTLKCLDAEKSLCMSIEKHHTERFMGWKP